ncbi:MAG: hypothetical protein U0M42_01685 [Acutalibacteraceae bacterium]|nr:hypothetical protein [Acutalibacteraceae bacterium]
MSIKKLIAVILTVLIAFCFCGCGAKEDIVGSYEAQIDVSQMYNSRYTSAHDLENYSLTGLCVTHRIDVKEDGSFIVFVSDEDIEKLKEQAVSDTKSALAVYYGKIISELNLDIEVQTYLASVGTDLDAVVKEMNIEEKVEQTVETLCDEGDVTATKKTFLSERAQGRLNGYSSVQEFTLKNGILKLNSPVLKQVIEYKKIS